MKNKILVLTLVTALLFAMSSCDFFAKEHEHQFGEEWVSDDSYHWHVCAGDECDEIADKAEHTGGIATETEKAKCETCGAEYGELLAHTHAFGEWETKTPANCDDAEVEIRYCACGASETQTGDAALGHSYTEQVVSEDYLATANCDEQASYYYSCACGAKGEEIFFTGDVIEHVYGEWQTKTAANCTDAEVEYRACACGAEETRTGDSALDHSMVNKSDEFEHWTECEREGCDEATEKVAHEPATLTVVSNLASPMQYDVVKVSDLTVTAGCDCGAQIPVTRGIIFNEFALAEGANTISVSFAGLTATTTVEAKKFGVVIDGKVTDDTYVYKASGFQEKNYDTESQLSANGDNFRVLLRYNFSDFLASAYYQAHKTEAKVQFTFTMTTGTITTEDAITFKVYPTSADRSAVSFSDLTWKTYDDEPHALGWSNAYGFVEKVANSNKVAIDGDKITITVAYRELEQFIDANGNAIFVFAIWKSSTKVGSIENDTAANRPTVQVILNDEHIHAFINETVDEKYFVSANCTEKAKYYYSCSCGAASDKIFEYGEVIEHQFGAWQTRTEANCLEAELEFRVCACGAEETQTGDAALDHDMQTKFDETNHWTECSRCDEATAPVAHFGGEATETEQATCEGCEQKYGGLASHVHEFGAWQTRTEATCTEAEVEFRKCECGAEETQIGDAALGHDMQTQYDANNHWTACTNGCGEATDPVAHFGGEATLTEQAICEGCGQPYGALKEPEKQEYTINGAIIADTDINSSSKTKDRSKNVQIYLYSTAARGFVFASIKDILDSEDFNQFKTDGIFYFTFTIAGNESDVNNTKFTLQIANPTYTDLDGATQYTAGIDASAITWNSVHVSGGAYYNALYLGDMKYLVGSSNGGKTLAQTDKVIYTAGEDGAAGTITYALTYDDIKDYVCMDTASEYYGQVVFKLRANGTGTGASSTLYYASSETATPPTVKFVYTK